jgi:hypothetical protein
LNSGFRPYTTGDIVPAYPYLWRRERDLGENAGRKGRPVCVAITVKDTKGHTHMALLAVTGTEPLADQVAVELPALEIRRIGLQAHKRAWVIVSEYNYDVLELSYALEPPRVTPRKLSPELLKTVLNAFRPVLMQSNARVDRR